MKIIFPGYDDENGSYLKALHDHLVYRYEVLEVLGKGSFGQVVKALDHKTGQHVAVKIIRNKKRYDSQRRICSIPLVFPLFCAFAAEDCRLRYFFCVCVFLKC